MLRIAVVGNTYTDVKSFVESKFKDQIIRMNRTNGIYELRNGDQLYLVYDEDHCKGMEYDAIIIHPLYQTLLDVIRNRTNRP